jgi:hypothetical protein
MLDITETFARGALGLFSRMPAGEVVADAHVEMKTELIIDITPWLARHGAPE